MIGKLILVLGILGMLAGIAIAGIAALLPIVTDGRTSWEEAMIGIIPGVLILLLSFVITVVGLTVIIFSRRKARE